jgi:hypothetical protein
MGIVEEKQGQANILTKREAQKFLQVLKRIEESSRRAVVSLKKDVTPVWVDETSTED